MESSQSPASKGEAAKNGASMLLVKLYRTTTGDTYCDRCSLAFLNTGVSMSPVPTGTPCTCDMCGLKSRAV